MNALDRLQNALVDRYRIESEAGAGGMATVYVARDLRHQRKVALKVLRPDLGAVLGADRFLNEIRVTAKLQHPNILPLFDSGEVSEAEGSSLLYYVMPFVEGESLRQRLDRERQLPVDEAVRIGVAIASALDYAHQHGVVHRDLKPENVMLQSGQPIVADFGIALAVSNASDDRLTQTGVSLGTPAYMSPEQATGDSHVDGRSDVYSLAAVVYEMLAGAPPHKAASAQSTIAKILTERPAPVSANRPSVPPYMDAVLSRALEKLPADRFKSAREFGDALEGRVSTIPAHAVSLPTTPTELARRRDWRRITHSPVWLIAFAVSTAVAAWAIAKPPERTTGGVSRFSILLPETQGLVGEPVVGLRISVSPDGRRIAYVGPGVNAGQSRIWLRSVDELNPRPIEGTDGGALPAFSPDGERLAFVTGTTSFAIRVVPVAGGTATVVADSGIATGGISWGNDGYIYFDGRGNNSILRVPEKGGATEVVAQIDSARREIDHLLPHALPNGRGVLMTVRRAGRGVGELEVAAVDTRTKQVHRLGLGVAAWHAASGHILVLNPAGTLLAASFDLDRLEVTGDFVPVASGFSISQLGLPDVAVSKSGVLAYTAGKNFTGNRELVWVTRDGVVTQVDSEWSGFFGGRVRLSPDGRTVAAPREHSGVPGNVWVKQLDRGPAMRIPDLRATDPGWSPDGRTLAFGSDDAIWIGPADGSIPPRQLTRLAGGRVVRRPEFTPDGEWLLFDNAGAILAYHLRGDNRTDTLITLPNAGTTAAAISPNGKWLAYNHFESGIFEAYIRPFPNVNASKRKVSVSGGLSPRWSRDGQELFFIDTHQDMIALPVRLDATLEVGEPKRLFSATDLTYPGGPGFDVSADGRFLMTRLLANRRSVQEELIVVENFLDDIRAKMKAGRKTP